jgi:hypothetical protein
VDADQFAGQGDHVVGLSRVIDRRGLSVRSCVAFFQ